MVTRVVFILLLAASASAQPAKNDYSDAKTWLCRPGRQDACAVDLTTTIVAANGSLKRVSARAGVPFRDADRVRDRVRLVPFDDPAAREQPVRSRPGENMQAVCANPAALGGGSGELHAYLSARGLSVVGSSSAPAWAAGKTIETPWVSVPGLLTSECVVNDKGSYLEITVHGDPNDPAPTTSSATSSPTAK